MDKEAGEKLSEVCGRLMETLKLTYQSFRKSTEESFQEAAEARNEVQRQSAELTRFLVSKSALTGNGKEWSRPFLSMVSSFDRMTFNIDGILDRLNVKMRGGVSFSDRGVREINEIFLEAMKLLGCLHDLFMSPDKPLAQQIGTEGRATLKIIDGYFEDHEERLIHGICVAKSSPIYLGILDSLRGIIAHTLEVSGKIVFLSSHG
jgi:Na+/phosphate symporter